MRIGSLADHIPVRRTALSGMRNVPDFGLRIVCIA